MKTNFNICKKAWALWSAWERAALLGTQAEMDKAMDEYDQHRLTCNEPECKAQREHEQAPWAVMA